MLSVQSLSHRFGAKEVLRDISLGLSEGGILAIMGASGGGKTTLLKCIAGLLRPTEGKVVVDGIDVAEDPEEARKRLGLVFQSAALFDYLNVEDNVAFGVRRQGRYSAKALSELVAKNLKRVGLMGCEKLMPSELSGGMRKRVGLARALAMEPKVLLYDEPTSGLDPVTAYAIDQLIVETRDRLGMASVVVSHDVSSVMRVAETIAFLDSGRLTFLGPVDEFGRSPNEAIRDLVDKARAESLGPEKVAEH